MDVEGVERKLAAIFSADVAGYTRLMAEDERSTLRALTSHRDAIQALVRQHEGRPVDAVGDNLMAEFASVVDAVACAAAVQEEIRGRNESVQETLRMRWRIGVNLGDIIVEGDRIYGDGVNISARVRTFSEPGGIAISGTAFDHVEGKLGMNFDNLGLRRVKNLPRPVRIYRVRLAAREAGTCRGELPVSVFSGRPAIAVLPFDNLGGDHERDYFADGLAEDLITRLSSWRLFPVIARHSSFAYRGEGFDLRHVSEELGARYVVEGSVRRVDETVRINAQLIDASSGFHLWARSFNRKLVDVLRIQDEIVDSIVGSMCPELRRFESAAAAQKRTEDLDAWDCFLRGLWHYYRMSQEDHVRASDLFRRAATLDPGFSCPRALLAWTHYDALRYGWTEAPRQTVRELVRQAEEAVELDEQDPFALRALGMARYIQGHRDRAIAAMQETVELDPSSAEGRMTLGGFLAISGRPEEALDHLMGALRLNPADPTGGIHLNFAMAHLAAQRYDDCAEWAASVLEARPQDPLAHLLIASSRAHLGGIEDAQRHLEKAGAELRGLRIRGLVANPILSAADPSFLASLVDGLRAAGLEE